MKRALIFCVVMLPCLAVLAQTAGQTNINAALKAVANSTTNSSAPLNSAASAYANDDKHVLRSGDKLSFQIVEDRDKPVPLLVTESSELEIPYIGRIAVTGKTCKQIADEAKILLEKDYYYTATVIVGLDSMSKVVGKVYVIGPVRNPGQIEIPAGENFTAGKAILRAGGFGDFADKKGVQIIRKSPTGNTTLKVNLADVFEKGKIEADVTLEDGDFIIVPQRAWNF